MCQIVLWPQFQNFIFNLAQVLKKFDSNLKNKKNKKKFLKPAPGEMSLKPFVKAKNEDQLKKLMFPFTRWRLFFNVKGRFGNKKYSFLGTLWFKKIEKLALRSQPNLPILGIFGQQQKVLNHSILLLSSPSQQEISVSYCPLIDIKIFQLSQSTSRSHMHKYYKQ